MVDNKSSQARQKWIKADGEERTNLHKEYKTITRRKKRCFIK